MSRLSVSQVLTRTTASIVEPDIDVTGLLASLLAGAVEALGASAGAILVELDGVLDVLSSTSHRVEDLELLQAQVDQGPCLEALRTGQQVTAVGSAVLTRWELTGPAIQKAGYLSVHATPLRWQGHVFGALNVFRTGPEPFEPEALDCQALADVITLVVITGQMEALRITDGLKAALQKRSVVEQAKGALAQVRGTAMSDAFDALMSFARDEGLTLGVAAELVMERARTGRLDRP